MARKCVVVSDLHLGRGNGQEDFRWKDGTSRDAAFEQFCRHVVTLSMGERLTFILNGDVIEFWELATDEELAGEDAFDAICRNLVFSPSVRAADPAAAQAFTRWQLDAALDAHPGFVDGMRHVLEADNVNVVYLFGNHDHAMVDPALQARFRERLGFVGDAEGRLWFDHWWEDAELLMYAEHGNQFADDDSRYRNVTDWREEALGYYALRFMWNRYQARYGVSQPGTAKVLEFIVRLILKRPTDHDLLVVQCLVDYFRAATPSPGRVALVPKLVGGYGLGMLYDRWVGCGMPTRADEILARQFSDGVAERVERTGSVRGFDAGLTPSSPWPGEAISTATEYDQYATGLVSRFRESPAPFRQLDKRRHQLLFIGHTHRPGRQPLHRMTRGIERQVYVNTGSWTRDTERPVYGFAEVTGRGVEVGLAELG